MALLWLIPSLIFFSALRYDWKRVWDSLAIYSVAPPFLDLRHIPAALRTLAHGGDPLAFDPFDQYQRPFNYPRIWLYVFAFFRITEHNVWIVGLLFSALYLLCVSKLILQGKTPLECFTLLLVGLSIAPLFGMERGNTDLPVFAVVFLGSVLLTAPQRAGMFLVATLLKLFPLVALVAETIRQRRKERLRSAAALVVAVFLLALQWKDLAFIGRGTPASPAASYGVVAIRETFWFWLTRHALLSPNGVAVACVTLVLCCWLAIVLAVVHAWRTSRWLDGVVRSREGDLFFIFGAIYACSFVIGSSWDYRLVFLIPTLPLAFALARTPKHSRWALAYLFCLLFAENCVAFKWGYKSLFSHVATFALFFLILAVLIQQLKVYLGIAITTSPAPVHANDAILENAEALR